MTTTSQPDCDAEWPDFVGTWPRLKGRQTPLFESKFDGDESLGDKCAAFGARIGLRCMPWEWLTVRAILSTQPPNQHGDQLWTHRDGAIECTRQQGKTLLIVLLILFHLYILKTKRIVYTAQRWSTAADVFDRVWAVIDRVPSLKRRLAEKPTKGGNRGLIKLTNGCKVEFGPRSQDFGRGYTEVDLLIIDESYDVDPAQEANLTGAQSAARNPQTLYLSTPPVAAEHPKCHILTGLHRLGHERAPDLYYALYAAPREMSRDDPKSWAMAQPSYGVATNEREIRSKRQKAKTAAQLAIFDADYMGWGDYPPEEGEATSPIPDDQWESLTVGADVELVGPCALALERSRNRKGWAMAAAQRTADGRIFVEIGFASEVSNAEMVSYTASAAMALNPIVLVIDAKSSAAVIGTELESAGIDATMTNHSQLGLASGGFLDDALAGNLAHAGQSILTDGVRSAEMREIPGGFTWDEPVNGNSVVYLKAATLARWALVENEGNIRPAPARPATAAARTSPGGQGPIRESGAHHYDHDELDAFAAF